MTQIPVDDDQSSHSDHVQGEVSPLRNVRKRAAPIQSNLGYNAQHSQLAASTKRVRKTVPSPGTQEYMAMPPVVVTTAPKVQPIRPRQLSFGSTPDNEAVSHLTVEQTPASNAVVASPQKRVRRPTEKAQYSRSRYQEGSEDVPKVNTTKVSAKPRVSQRSATSIDMIHNSEPTIVVKSESVDESEFLQSPFSAENTPKGKRPARFLTPIELSSSEDEAGTPTPKGNQSYSHALSTTTISNFGSPSVRSERRAPPSTLIASAALKAPSQAVNIAQLQATSVGNSDGMANSDIAAFSSDDDMPASIILAPRNSTTNAGPAVQTPTITQLDMDNQTLVDTPTGPSVQPAFVSASALTSPSVYYEDLVPQPPRVEFSLVPWEKLHGPANCPVHLLYESEDGTAAPIELVAAAFNLFKKGVRRSIQAALLFQELRPFVNVTHISRSQIYAEKYKHHVMWSGLNKSVIFTMLGSVQTCNIINPSSYGAYDVKEIKIVPYGESWRKFLVSLGELYKRGPMVGPFEFGCILTLSSRRSGWAVKDAATTSMPVTPKKNSRAFGASPNIVSTLDWFNTKLPNCIDFTKPIPIYDASEKSFLFGHEDFVGMPNLPLYRKAGQLADLPLDSVVSVFFALASYSKDAPASAPASFAETLSMNLHYVIYYGVLPGEVEE